MWGFTGILGKLIHLESLVIVWHRVLIAFLALGLFMVVRKYPMRIASFKDGFKLVGVGVIVALHWITFYKSIQL